MLDRSGSNNIILIFTYLIFSLGLFNFIRIFKKFNFSNFTGLFKNSGLLEVLIYSSLILYFMISASPVTNADSLDYHLHIGKQIAVMVIFHYLLIICTTFIWKWRNYYSNRYFSRNRATKFNCNL